MALFTCKTLGDARTKAQECANRDDCKWILYFCEANYRDTYNHGNSYAYGDEFEKPTSYIFRSVETISPNRNKKKADEKIQEKDPRGEPVYLTEEEKQIVAAVLHPDEPGRDYFPGSEQAKLSLRFKLLGFELTMGRDCAKAKLDKMKVE